MWSGHNSKPRPPDAPPGRTLVTLSRLSECAGVMAKFAGFEGNSGGLANRDDKWTAHRPSPSRDSGWRTGLGPNSWELNFRAEG